MYPAYGESERPRCPFCGQPFGRPPELDPKRAGDFYIWRCSCKAIGAYDATGHNVGDALMEAIVYAFEGDWEKALAMQADEDYEIGYIDGYDPREHRVMRGRVNPKSGLSAFVFVRLKVSKHLH